jgi:hypothetical protein
MHDIYIDVFVCFFGSATPCASPPSPRPSIFSDYSFWSTTFLTGMTGISLHMQCAMASDFSAAWQCLSKRTIFFVTDQTPRPYPTRSLPAQFWHRCTEWSTVWVLSKPLITEENWPGQGLNPGLPNDTPALYPLLHELMLHIHSCFTCNL